MSEHVQHKAMVLPEQAGQRIDQVAAELFGEFSRARLQEWIKSGHLTVDGAAARSKDKAQAGNVLVLDAELEPRENWAAQELKLDVVYEDSSLLVINKPAGLVVHPGAGSPDGTLLNALLFRD
ncbi:MAG TPA: S4 domain-containing protein, partial [Pseudomonadales bacterium]|nr:S4 domain-containing protein [Pseudomonadales bacterium]